METSSVKHGIKHSSEGVNRRDFLKGASVVGGSLLASELVAAQRAASGGHISEPPGQAAPPRAVPPQSVSAPLTATERKVLDLIKPDEVASVLQDMVHIPTPGRNEQALAEYLAGRMREWGIRDTMIQGIEGWPGRANFIARLHGKAPKGPTLMATSHLDSIAVDDTADRDKWIVDPFSGEIREGRVYGRGASDNKSGCIAVVMAAKAIKQAGVELSGDLLIGLVADEEGYMLGVKQFIKSGLHKEVSGCFTGDGALSYVPATRPGRTAAEISFYGTNAHAGTSPRRGVGVNAIHKAGKFIAAIAEAVPNHPPSPYYGPSFFQVLRVNGGWGPTQTSQKPALCRIFLDVRLVPGHEPDDAWNDIRKILDKLAAEDSDFKAEIGEIDRRPGYKLNWDWPVVKAGASAYEALAGKPAAFGDVEPSGVPSIGTTDTAYLIYEDVPCCGFVSPATRGGIAHAANEHAVIESLTTTTKAAALSFLRYWNFVRA